MDHTPNDSAAARCRMQFLVFFIVFALLYAVADFGLTHLVHGPDTTGIRQAQGLLCLVSIIPLTPVVLRRLRHFQASMSWIWVLWVKGVLGLRKEVMSVLRLKVNSRLLDYLMFGAETLAVILFPNLLVRPGGLVERRTPMPILAYSEF